MAAPTPSELEIRSATQLLIITWEDGHVSHLPWWYLRGLCPCAVCQGHGGPLRFVDGAASPQLGDVDEVGRYALRLTWDDGHQTGIYSFGHLRRLCLCAACRAAGGAVHPAEILPADVRARLP